jgi:hypothetical protein
MAALIIPLELELTPRSREVMQALSRTLGPQFRAQESEAVHTSALPTVGEFVHEHGGFFHGVLLIGGRLYGEVTGPKVTCEVRGLAWLAEEQDVPGARSESDSLANTRAMAEAGSPLALAAQACRSGGFSDWAVPARMSGLLQHENLHPHLPEAEAFDKSVWYRLSTQCSRNYAWLVDFKNGNISIYRKSWAGGAARFVRRFALNP